MPRRSRNDSESHALHVVNRAAGRVRLFGDAWDYAAFVRVLDQSLCKTPTRLLAFCLMETHWHLVVWPVADELPRFMHRLTMTHAKRWRKAHHSCGTGPVYQNRYYSSVVQGQNDLLRVIKYVERNPLTAGMVRRAEDWRWSSLWCRCNNCHDVPLAPWPFPRPADWVERVNSETTPGVTQVVR